MGSPADAVTTPGEESALLLAGELSDDCDQSEKHPAKMALPARPGRSTGAVLPLAPKAYADAALHRRKLEPDGGALLHPRVVGADLVLPVARAGALLHCLTDPNVYDGGRGDLNQRCKARKRLAID